MLYYKIKDVNYPKLLRQITNPPEKLYYRGVLDQRLFPIAIVGSRKLTAYGTAAIDKMIAGLAGLPVVIVSGLAYGADAHAHRTALKHKLKTIAVLGSGIDDNSIYPRENKPLALEIIKNGGAVISEFPERTAALPAHFPQRNRIISGLSRAVIIIEADLQSGALITANLAVEQNRDLFAIPGSIFNILCTGPNELIKQGAFALTCAQDLINYYEELAMTKGADANNTSSIENGENENKILQLLKQKAMTFEELSAHLKLPISETNSCLSALELNNQIHSQGNYFFAS